MSTSVKHITNSMRGAPQIKGNTPGCLIAVLDSLFVTGWGTVTALSGSVSGGIATLLFSPGDSFVRDAVVLVSGATPSEVNGEVRVATASNTSIAFPTTASDGAITGTIAVKYAPQSDWEKSFSGTNKAAYKSNNAQSNGHYLRVDDAGTVHARVRGYEVLTDVDTGTGPFPTDAQASGGGYIWKGSTSNATEIKYRIFCDERFVVFAIAAGSAGNATYSGAPARGFGDPIHLSASGDAWGTIVSASGGATSQAMNSSLSGGPQNNASGLTVAARGFSGFGGAALQFNSAFTGGSSASGSDTTGLGVFPSAIDGQAKISKIYSRDAASGSPPRSIIPGVFYIPQSGALGLLADGDFLDGSGDLSGRRMLVVSEGGFYTGIPTGCYLVDVTGPWR